MVRLGQKVSSPYGPGMVVGFSRYHHFTGRWMCHLHEAPITCVLTDGGPFVAVVMNDQFPRMVTVRAIRYDDLNLASTLGEQAVEMLVKLTGGMVDL